MQSYLISIVITSVAIGFYNVLTPKHNGIEKIVKLIGMLIILLTVLGPILNFLKNFDDDVLDSIKDELSVPKEEQINDYSTIFQEYLNSSSLVQLEEKIKEILEKNYAIPKGECQVNIFTQNDGVNASLDKIQILLSGASIFKNPYHIEDHIKQNLGCDCQVLIK